MWSLKMKNELEIRKELANIEKKSYEGEPYSEIKRVAMRATKGALEWVIEEKESPLTG